MMIENPIIHRFNPIEGMYLENPIIRGFNPDPSICRKGQDFYIVTSTFEWWPGIAIYHSRDLANWKLLDYALKDKKYADLTGVPNSGGIWAPDITYNDGKFYLTYSVVRTTKGYYRDVANYLVTAEDITGPWSEPLYLNSTGWDPSLFHDGDKAYLVNMIVGFKGILVQEFDKKNNCLTGEAKMVFKGTQNGYTEGPHIYKYGKYYYMLTAEGGTGYGHCVTAARSESVWGPYELDPDGPVLTSREDSTLYLQKAGHADFVELDDGTIYLAHLCARPVPGTRNCIMGRETAIQKAFWNEDGWLRVLPEKGRPVRLVELPQGVEVCQNRDDGYRKYDFDEDKLSLDFQMLRGFDDEEFISVKKRKGFLRLVGMQSISSRYQVSIAAIRQKDFKFQATACMDFEPENIFQSSGIIYMYDDENFYYLFKSVDENGNAVLKLLECDAGKFGEIGEVKIPGGEKRIYLRVCTENAKAQFYYSSDAKNYIKIGKVCDASRLSDEYSGGSRFTGAFVGMLCQDTAGGKKYADFDWFEYAPVN